MLADVVKIGVEWWANLGGPKHLLPRSGVQDTASRAKPGCPAVCLSKGKKNKMGSAVHRRLLVQLNATVVTRSLGMRLFVGRHPLPPRREERRSTSQGLQGRSGGC